VLCGDPAVTDQRVRSAAATMPHRGAARVVHAGDVQVAVLEHPARPGTVDVACGRGDLAVVCGPVDEVEGTPSTTPAGAVLAALQAGQPAAAVAQRMRGAHHVVALIDGRILAWRDHVGFGPLFWSYDGTGLAVASEPGAALTALGRPLRADLSVVEDIFYSRQGDDLGAGLAGAHRLPKSTLLQSDARGRSGPTTARYWTPDDLIESRGRGQATREEFDALMTQAVRRVLRGNDVVGLSGGVDSPAVAAYAVPGYVERYGHPLAALSTVYPDLPSVDESDWIALVADRLGLELTTFEPVSSSLDQVDRYARLIQGPVSHSITSDVEMFYQRVAAAGHEVLLTGEFAEYLAELRGGLLPYLVHRGRWGGAARFLASKRAGGARRRTILREIARAAAPTRVAEARRRGRPDPTVPEFVDGTRVDRRGVLPARQAWRETQKSAFYGAGVTVEADEVLQQVAQITCRRPWIDVDLWEFFLSMRAEDKFPGSPYKALLKTWLRGRVPDEILDRRTFTSFEASMMKSVDYVALRRSIGGSQWRMPGVDYELLCDRLEREDLSLYDFVWASDLAGAHAFVAAYG
jgi:asparagine synthase (glutamine-hydrolysing)